MSSAPMIQSSAAIRIQIVRGSSKSDSVFNKAIIKIGRTPENDVSFMTDQKVSREHAEIIISNNQAYIRNLSRTSPLLVNGGAVTEAPLPAGALVQVGDSEFIFQPTMSPGRVEGLATHASSAPARGNKLFFYMVAALLVGGLLVLVQSGPGGKNDDGLRGSEEIAEDILRSQKTLEELQKQQQDSGEQSSQYKMAQEHYIKGFRDFRNSQFSRAIQSFQAALSFYPQHELARKYLIISKRKFDETVQFNMIQGRRYLAKNNYRMCASAFSKVMIMVKDPNDMIYKEAKQYFEECQFNLQGRF